MQPTVLDPANLFRLVYFFDILAAVVFAVSGALVASRKGLGIGRLPAMSAGFLVTFSERGLAIKFGWSLPVFRQPTNRERWI